jgi:eukaryotic-like serine/threonine-protein kinase
MTSTREQLDQGLAALQEYRALRESVERAQSEAEQIKLQFQGWQPIAEKRPIWEAQDRVIDLKGRLGRAAAEAEVHLIAVTHSGEATVRGAARSALADYYMERFLEFEARQDPSSMALLDRLVRAYDDGSRARAIAGDGELTLETDPDGAEVLLHRFEEDGFMLRPGSPVEIGRTPIRARTIERGSYLAVLKKAGYQDTKYPLFIKRSTRWTGSARLFRPSEIGEGFAHVPAGLFIEGGDPETRGWSLPASDRWVDDFFIAVHPVLSGEYVEFINDLAKTDREIARGRAPRAFPARGSYLVEQSDGRFELPPPGEDGQVWHPRIPVFGISWYDAMAYCEWKSARDGCPYRLPTEHEWEKAARGVDGRWYPWGARFDAGMCNMRDSRKEGPGPVVIDEFPTDESVYGVRGMAGNVRDWTATRVSDTIGEDALIHDIAYRKWYKANEGQVIRGGAWSPLVPRIADRYWITPDLVLSFLGFRLAKSPR